MCVGGKPKAPNPGAQIEQAAPQRLLSLVLSSRARKQISGGNPGIGDMRIGGKQSNRKPEKIRQVASSAFE